MDIKGRRFGSLIAKKPVGGGMWECKCDCGNTAVVREGDLTWGKIKSCGCMSFRGNLVGTRQGNLEVGNYDREKKRYKCKCDCGRVIYLNRGEINAQQYCGEKDCPYRYARLNHKELTIDGETHNYREWDRVMGVKEGNVSHWMRCCGEKETIRRIRYILEHKGEPRPWDEKRYIKNTRTGERFYTITRACNGSGLTRDEMFAALWDEKEWKRD